MAATRLMPSEESRALIEMTREVCRKELAPKVDAFEREGGFPHCTMTELPSGSLALLASRTTA